LGTATEDEVDEKQLTTACGRDDTLAIMLDGNVGNTNYASPPLTLSVRCGNDEDIEI
jgi:hypothetical protein